MHRIEQKHGPKKKKKASRLRKNVKKFEFQRIYHKLLVSLPGCRGRCSGE